MYFVIQILTSIANHGRSSFESSHHRAKLFFSIKRMTDITEGADLDSKCVQIAICGPDLYV